MTAVWVLLGLTVLVAFVGAGVAVGKANRPSPPPRFGMTLPADLQERVRVLVEQRRAIEAIKEVRQRTGLSLKDAKELVDAVRDGRLPSGTGEYGSAAVGWSVPEGNGPEGRSLADRARALRDAGDHDGAVTLVCSETGMSRHEAERFVGTLG